MNNHIKQIIEDYIDSPFETPFGLVKGNAKKSFNQFLETIVEITPEQYENYMKVQSIKDYFKEITFEWVCNYSSKLAPQPNGDIMVDGWKIARFKSGGKISYTAVVVLHLLINARTSIISRSTNYQIEKPFNLIGGEKYCTNKCVIYSAYIIGPMETVIQSYDDYGQTRGKIISNFADAFIYEIGNEIVEHSFGEPGRGCIQGVHFFSRELDALKWVGTMCRTDYQYVSSPVIYANNDEPDDTEWL